ncbi:non-ribosomal peptide synthetase [Streptomyces reniochalinae]|uniref:Non-ribosomal peptide synthetase n=1 Tax=Streptomyces reniochalinae TaxID=2250578 RepID=A0A367E6W9_9ACTN|nr:non-ribosomal peptide synthetase [Streptomyces reniochalinae]RCG13806.1 non-ribosomal peptide synthetase [Streptomyces reniochalinae]
MTSDGPATAPERKPASPKEQALWLLEEYVPGTGVNNLNTTFRVEGRLRHDIVRQTVAGLVRTYEVLRGVFKTEPGGLVREVLDAEEAAPEVLQADLSSAELIPWLTDFVARPFAPDGELLLRAAHVREGTADIVCIAVHHANFDGRSAALLLEEFVARYNALAAGTECGTQTVPAWQEQPARETSETFWRTKLEGVDASASPLWCAKPDPAVTTLAGDVLTRTLSPAARDAVKRMQQDLRAPESVVLTAAYGVLLASHGAGTDLTIGSPVNVRSPEAEAAIGYHANVVVLRTPVDRADSFRSFVRLNRREFFQAMAQADYSAERVIEYVPRAHASGRNSLFRYTFNYAPADTKAGFVIGGHPARQLMVETGTSKFDLEFFVTSTADALEVRAGFGVDVFDHEDIAMLLARYDELLVTLASRPDDAIGELPVWARRDHDVIGRANDTACPVRPDTLLEMLAATVSTAPETDRPAVVDGARSVGVRRLWAAAEATRGRLTAAGIGKGDVVALLARRGPELVAAVFGVWLCGAAYLPLDPDHPEERVSYQLDDSGAVIVLAGEDVAVPGDRVVLPLVHVDSVTPTQGTVLAQSPVSADDQAYLIYTSGSTGRPKGTRIRHGALANLVTHFADALDARGRSMLWVTTFSFDMSTLELFLPLGTGGTLVVAPDEARTQGTALAEALDRHDASVLSATPTTWRLVLDEVAGRLAGRTVIIGGEPLPAPLAGRLAATGCTLFNLYGPTEATVWSTGGTIKAGSEDTITVGTPIANTQVHVMTQDGAPLPLGVQGELCIAGAGLSLGYHNRPDLDAERFGEHPSCGRYYRTGDLARWTHDGQLEILGRMDRQVKLRGNRIELGEVEEVLLSHPDLTGAAVVLVGEPSADGALWAFVTAPEQPGIAARLWEHARGLLPAAATPNEFVVVDAFPMTGSDKVDYPALRRRAEGLRAARKTTDDVTDERTEHGDDLVVTLVGLYKTALDRGDLDADSNFFAHGGHSLLGVKLLQEVQSATQVRLKLKDLFDSPTPSGLARRLRAEMS